jgi:hypothetical protein
VSLLWAVPVVAVAVAAGLVLVRVRAIEQACLDLVVATRRTGELQVPMADLRRELRRSGPLVDRVWSHWDPGDDPDHDDPAQR